MINCVLEGMRKYMKMLVNYEKVKGMTQEEKDNPVLFHGWLVQAFRKYSNIDLFTSKDQCPTGTALY